jgi:branched-subunit amino acid ABC-type transport system permease component
MDVGLFTKVLVNGLMSGGIYALVATGFTLILGVIQVFNFTQGHVYMLGAFVTYAVVSALGLPYPVAILAALLAMAGLGALMYFGIIQWTMPSGFFHTLLVTVACGSAISQTSLLTFGFQDRVVPAVVTGSLNIAGTSVSGSRLVVLAGAIAVMLALYYFMRTKMGTAMVAAAENRDVAGLQGINARQIFWMTMAVGCGLSGIAGALIVPVLSASVAMGTGMFTRVMMVVLVGGMGSMSGALLAAFIVGVVESFAYQFVGELSLVVIFVLVAILMFFRPGGLLGKPLPVPGDN